VDFPRSLILLLTAALALVAGPARADSWVAPQRTTYYSANRAMRLIVTPHVPSDRNLRPYVTEPLGPSAPDSAAAALQHLGAGGRWRTEWQGQLRNEVMPVNAMVADSGDYFVTFDDWGGTGWGPNVVVIYRADGSTVRAYQLDEIVPAYMVDAFAGSVSSLWWQGQGTRIEGDKLRLAIVAPGSDIPSTASGFFIDIDLATGSAAPIAEADLAHWRPVACERHRRAVAERQSYVERERADLTGPTSEDAHAWEFYGLAVASRLYWPNIPLVISAPEPTEEFYAMKLSSLRHFLASPAEGQGERRVFVASRQDVLVAEVERAAGDMRPGRLAGLEMTFVADAAHWQRIAAALAASGAALRQVDPSRPLPQQPRALAELPPLRTVDPACAS
jgi:hypothetical protein